ALKEYFAPLLATSSEENRMRFDKNPLRLLDSKEPEDQPYIANAPKITDYLCDECKAHFAAVRRYLDMYGVPYDL
ncbi:MAG TPA: histidine--tRNA ligase, partial [Ktedonobacter sp.]|nr:histidine--tRNA ligase [Ktedonobacter sp.]